MPDTNDRTKQVPDLEIKDAQVIFGTVWEDLEEEIGHENLRFPKELILLGGAPGAGKGTHTRFIMNAQGSDLSADCRQRFAHHSRSSKDQRPWRNGW